jgi:hypothetical protein
VDLYPPQLPQAAVLDFPTPKGKTWPDSYQIHRACEKPARVIPSCPAGTSGEAWSTLVARAPTLLGQAIAIRDPLVVGSWASCYPFDHPGWRICYRGIAGGSLVLGQADPPLSILVSGHCSGDESRLCCNLPAFGQTVVAKGVLRRTNEWYLDHPTICEVANPAATDQ